MSAPSPATPVAPDVWRITTPLPFRPRTVHAFLVRLAPARWMLVDGGIDTDEAWQVVDGAVSGLVGEWGQIGLHVVTHMHQDHIGLVRRVRDASGAPLAMGALDAERVAHAAARPDDEAAYRERLLHESGAPDPLIAAVQADRARGDTRSALVPVDHPLPCDTAPLPGAEGWSAVWTPGHTAGHTSLFRAADGVLLAGDAVLPRITPTIGVNRQREDPVGDYLRALEQLGRLGPRLLLPGHGEPVQEPASRLGELADATREESARVAALLSSAGASAWDVVQRRYPDREMSPSTQMLALRETRAHLEHLVRAGAARAVRRGEVVLFSSG